LFYEAKKRNVGNNVPKDVRGSRKTQAKDIKTAHLLWQEYKQEKAGKK
jgi:hypothetical protein